MITALIESIRPAQWIKNIVVFAALIFARHTFEPEYLVRSVWAFVLFCLVSSGIYLLNDITDREQDAVHPVNRRRPIASGRLPVPAALSVSLALLLVSLAGAFYLAPLFGVSLAAYFILNLLYIYLLKPLVILDIFAIAGGFALRVIGGALAIEVLISNWLLVCTILLSLFLALGKRRAELALLGTEAAQFRATLGDYSPALLDQMISIVTSATVVSYTLYTLSPETVAKFQTTNLKYTIPFVLYGIFRYLYLIYRGNKGGQPEQVLMRDVPMIITILCYLAAVGFILY